VNGSFAREYDADSAAKSSACRSGYPHCRPPEELAIGDDGNPGGSSNCAAGPEASLDGLHAV
jgi:hypothetical protein